MSVVSIPTSNVNMGNQGYHAGTTQLSNLWMGTTNVSLNTIWTTKLQPRQVRPANFGFIKNKKYLTIRLYSNDINKGTVSITYPISITAAQGVGIDYAFDYSTYSYVTISANQTYPYTFQRWETRTPLPAGTNISTTAATNLYSTDWTGYLTVTAVFA